MGRVIVITSGKGGVGKTTTTANVGTGALIRANGLHAGANQWLIVTGTDYSTGNGLAGKCAH